MSKINPLIALGIPSWGRVTVDWARAYRSLGGPLGSSMVEIPVIGAEIAAARNYLMQAAVDAKADFLFMLGDDVLCPPSTITTLLQRLWDNPDLDLVCGMYWTKQWPTTPYIWKDIQRGPYLDWKHGEFFEIDFSGCDCLLIRMSDRMKDLGPQWFSTEWRWQNDQNTVAPMLTEDFYFYTRTREAGMRLYCDSNVQCLHEDRTTGAKFGLTTDMPQHANGAPARLPDVGERKVRIAEVGCGFDVPFMGHANEVEVVRFDGNEAAQPDFRCDLRRLPAADQSFDIVHSRHVLEHFPVGEAPKVLREWLRVLRVGGELRLSVPNFLHACKQIVAMEEGTVPPSHYPWWQAYGQQVDERDLHHNGFTPRKLAKLLEVLGQLGDIKVEVGDDGINLYATAIKTVHPELWSFTEHWDAIAAKEAKALTGVRPDGGNAAKSDDPDLPSAPSVNVAAPKAPSGGSSALELLAQRGERVPVAA